MMVNLYGVVNYRRKNQFAEFERKTNYPLALTGTWLIFIHVDCGGRILFLGKLISGILCGNVSDSGQILKMMSQTQTG